MSKLKSKIESLLFIAAKPLSIKQVADLAKVDEDKARTAANELMAEYEESRRGIRLIKNNAKYQMVSSPDNAEVVKAFVKDETQSELTRPSLETLTIVAYRGPIAKSDLDRIRGVNCSLILRNLLIKGLIETVPGEDKEEAYYNVSFDFIRYLGISSVNELPDYADLHTDEAVDRLLKSKEEEK